MQKFLSRQIDTQRDGSASGTVNITALGAPRSLRFIVVTSLLATLASLIAGLIIVHVVQRSIREITRQNLRSIQSANIASIQLWFHTRQTDAKKLADNDSIRSLATQLLTWEELATPQAESTKSDLVDRLADTAALNAIADRYIGWGIVNGQGIVVASGQPALMGQPLPIPTDSLNRIASGRVTVTRPFPSPVAFTDVRPRASTGGSVMIAMAPITDGNRSAGSFALFIDPLGPFTQLLSVARTVGSGETYAFDRHGVLLSASRFEDQLYDCGLLQPGTSSVLNISIRDPGSDLTTGSSTNLPTANFPLTLMADQATRGGTGENVNGYRDYRGVLVAGAWSWLPDYEMGIATEVDIAEAYSPMQVLKYAMFGLFGLLLLSFLGLLFLADIYQRVLKRLTQANQKVRRLGQYQLGNLIGYGGMGAVYRGSHDLLRRDVAIKVLESNKATATSESRFTREVQMTSMLTHPNTIDVYDYGRTEDGTFFYVMEYIEGITLQQLVDQYGRQPPERVIYLLLQVCGSLSEAHGHHMVHRDVKPANILITSRAGLFDMVKVLDFGLVKEVDRDTVELTVTESITGTPHYMSPESVRDASSADQVSDLYSVGAVGYTLLTGLPLFDGKSKVDVCLRQLNDVPVRPDARIESPLPEDLQNVLMNCLCKEPADRPRSAEELADALRSCRDSLRWTNASARYWWEHVYRGPIDFEHTGRDNDNLAPTLGEFHQMIFPSLGDNDKQSDQASRTS